MFLHITDKTFWVTGPLWRPMPPLVHWKDLQPIKICNTQPKGSILEQTEEEYQKANWLTRVYMGIKMAIKI